mgnify:FL=1
MHGMIPLILRGVIEFDRHAGVRLLQRSLLFKDTITETHALKPMN